MSQTSRPNFLFITTDQQRWDAVGIHNPVLQTPSMDRLARQGLQFSRMYPTNAICMPSRASMITGRSQRGRQVFNHDVNLSEAIPVLGDSLRDAGYETALIGKAHFRTADLEDLLPDHPPAGTALIDDELGDPASILPAREPGGSLRDRRMMEPQPEVRADLGDRLRGILEG